MLNSKLVDHAFDIVERDITDGLRSGYVLNNGTQYEENDINELFQALLALKVKLNLDNLDRLALQVKTCENLNRSGFSYQIINIAIDTIRVELNKETNSHRPRMKP